MGFVVVRPRLSRSAAPRAAAEVAAAQFGALLAADGRALGSVARAPLQSQQAIGKLCASCVNLLLARSQTHSLSLSLTHSITYSLTLLFLANSCSAFRLLRREEKLLFIIYLQYLYPFFFEFLFLLFAVFCQHNCFV